MAQIYFAELRDHPPEMEFQSKVSRYSRETSRSDFPYTHNDYKWLMNYVWPDSSLPSIKRSPLTPYISLRLDLVQIEFLENIMSSIERPNFLSKNIHRQSSEKDSDRHAPTRDEHQSHTSCCSPIVEKIRESEEHKILECDRGHECLHGYGAIRI
jgi:hypothetical protein